MAVFGHIGLTGVGSVEFKLIDYNRGIPERSGSMSTTIDGPTIHFTAQVQDSDWMPNGVIKVNYTDKETLESIYESSTIIGWFDDGERSFRGYLKNLQFISANKNIVTIKQFSASCSTKILFQPNQSPKHGSN